MAITFRDDRGLPRRLFTAAVIGAVIGGADLLRHFSPYDDPRWSPLVGAAAAMTIELLLTGLERVVRRVVR